MFFFFVDINRFLVFVDNIFIDNDFRNVLLIRNVIHQFQQIIFHNRTQAAGAGLAFNRLLAIARKAPSVIVSLTPSISNNVAYCLTSAFFGSVKTLTRASSFKSSSVAMTGRRPTNSGINPYLSKSSGCTSFRISPMPRSSLEATFAPKPIDVSLPRRLTIFPNRQKRRRR